jgi:hypothetical protein
MTVHTSIGFILVSHGLLCFVWSRDLRAESWLPGWMPIPLALGILTATLCFWQALMVASSRIQRQYEGSTSLSDLAGLILIVGALLAVAMALAAYLAQESSRRARELARTNQALTEEIRIREETQKALQAHRHNLEKLVAERTRELDQARQDAEGANLAKRGEISLDVTGETVDDAEWVRFAVSDSGVGIAAVSTATSPLWCRRVAADARSS